MGKHNTKIHNVCKEYSEKKHNKTIIKKLCNYCNWTTVKNATRPLNHILDCCKCPKNTKDVFMTVIVRMYILSILTKLHSY
jgi:hypothetical protein